MSVYSEVKETGGYIDRHSSDLYIEVNAVNDEILGRYPTDRANARKFVNQVTGKLCYDIPFAYTPYWEAKQKGK